MPELVLVLLSLLELLVEELEELLELLVEELELLLLLLKEPLLKPLVELFTFDFPPLDLKLLEELLELLELLNPPELLKPLDPLDFADTVISPWVILSKIGIVSIRKLEVKKIKIINILKVIFL